MANKSRLAPDNNSFAPRRLLEAEKWGTNPSYLLKQQSYSMHPTDEAISAFEQLKDRYYAQKALIGNLNNEKPLQSEIFHR
jgi:hypothetical protein